MEAQSVREKKKKKVLLTFKSNHSTFRKKKKSPNPNFERNMSHSTTIACKNSNVQRVLLKANSAIKTI